MVFSSFSTLASLPGMAEAAVTVGSYDGVHTGHREMIARLCDVAHGRGLQSVLVTFEPHHRIFFRRETLPFLLTTTPEKRSLLTETRLDQVVVLPFSSDLASLTARQFIENILVDRLGARVLLVGHDQALGRDQCTGVTEIAKSAAHAGVEVLSPNPVWANGDPVSSTRIRSLIREGSLDQANRLLGSSYLLSGKVVHGRGRGRSLGHPTANIKVPDPFKLVPSDGIYAVTATVGGDTHTVAGDSHIGMGYIGTRPTFDETEPVIEIALLDADMDLYDRELEVHFVERVRADHRFATKDQLLAQIQRDEGSIRKILGRGTNMAI